MLFGDSITQGGWEDGGFGARLAHVYSRKFDVLNRGLSGYNSEWAIPVFEQYFAKQHEQKHAPKICLLTIWFGANDACIKPSPQHLPLEKYTANLRHLVDMVRSSNSAWYSPDTAIILITPPPVNTHQRSADLRARDPPKELDRLFDTTKSYADAVLTLGAELSVPVVDIWKGLWDAVGHDEAALSTYLRDGLHLNAAGYSILYDLLMAAIVKHVPTLDPSKLRDAIPRWDEINWDDPRPSLVKRDVQIPQ